MDALDQVAFAVRFQLRNLRSAAYNYQAVQRKNMELAYLLVDQALQAFNQPAAAGGGTLVSPPGGNPTTGDPAALTQQLITVQGKLVGAQNDLFLQWLAYLQNRINLYRDMGLMPLDSRGLWDERVTYKGGVAPEGVEQGGHPRVLPQILPMSHQVEPVQPTQELPPVRLLAPIEGTSQ
jgi:hypothetical protein